MRSVPQVGNNLVRCEFTHLTPTCLVAVLLCDVCNSVNRVVVQGCNGRWLVVLVCRGYRASGPESDIVLRSKIVCRPSPETVGMHSGHGWCYAVADGGVQQRGIQAGEVLCYRCFPFLLQPWALP